MGHGEAWEPLAALGELIADLQPTLLVATGDLAHRGRRRELETAAELLRGLGLPFLAVPGNHDIPYTVPARFTRTFTEWERVFGETEPLHADEGVVVVGLNSVRRGASRAVRWRTSGSLARCHGSRRAPLAPCEWSPCTTICGAAMAGRAKETLEPPRQGPPHARRGRHRARRRRTCAPGRDCRATRVQGARGRTSQSARPRDRAQARSSSPAAARRSARPERLRSGPDTLTVRTYAWDGQALLEVGRRMFART